MRFRLPLLLFLLAPAGALAEALPPAPAYPVTATVPVSDTLFGQTIADPYRWLEDDVRVNPAVATWVTAQNQVTDAYLDALPGRDALAAAMTRLFDYRRFGVPEKRGNRYFYTENSGLQNQSVLMVRDGLAGTGRRLIDPNSWAADGATALDAWHPSDDGARLAYLVQDGGSDWRTIRVLDVATGAVLPDMIQWAKFTNIAWIGNEGFVYSRFPAPAEGAAFQSLNRDHTLYYHKLGTPQSEDRVVYATPDAPDLSHVGQVSDDGRWLIITSSSGTDEKYELRVVRIGDPAWRVRPLVNGFDHDWRLVGGVADTLWFVTDREAARGRIVRVTLPADGAVPPAEAFATVVPERGGTIQEARLIGDAMLVSWLDDARSVAERMAPDGSGGTALALDGVGTLAGITGKAGDPEAFYAFSGFTRPASIRQLDSATGASTSFAEPKLAFNPDDYVTEQRFYRSKDGTRVPMFIVRHKDVTGSAPTLLYGYGGFNISLTPGFSATRMAWLVKGGVFAQANLRGGGEYGKAWHDAGRLANKQNVFDDFIAAGEFLKSEGITGPQQLVIEGRSNGGLLVGAVVNQRPDLFAAAHAAVGVMDMLRFDRFTAGRYWVDDYGYPSKEADFRAQLAYSPYHNIRAAAYPAVIVSTADTDDRVVPGHSFKYIARLQAAEAGSAPRLIRIETRAGHGSGKPTDKLIAEYADIYAFLAAHSGLTIRP